MKRLGLALLALLFATQALAAGADPVPAYQATRKASRYERIAVIRPSRWDGLNQGNVASMRRNIKANLGTIWEACRDRGLEVHFYDTNFFEQTGNAGVARDLWENMGSQYAAAVVLWPTNFAAVGAVTSRFLCADSTNTQLIVIGGSSGNGNLHWAADTTIRGFVDTFASGTETGTNLVENAYLVTQNCARADTLWSKRWATGKRIAALPTGMTSVKRIFRLGRVAGSTLSWIQTADSANANLPTGGDSVAVSGEYLGPMWKTTFTNNLADVVTGQGAIDASLLYTNTLPSSLCPREVYWIKTPSQTEASINTREYPQLLWAAICRFTTAKPILWAFDMDDMTDKATDNTTTPERWTNAEATAFFDTLNAYGVIGTPQINPSNAIYYLSGTNPPYESAWSGDPHTYLKGRAWIHHAHDSTSGYIGSNLNGARGGYTTGNGAAFLQGGVNVEIRTPRLASRWQPGVIGRGGAGVDFGIVQRLFWSDSVRKAVCPTCFVPPYLSFPANNMLPVNYRARLTTTNPLWTYHYSPSAECPPESLLWAYHVGLKRPAQEQNIYLRMLVSNPKGGTAGDIGTYWQFDRDSVMASSMFIHPKERYSVRGPDGRLVTAIAVGSFQSGSANRLNYTTAANNKTAVVLGLKNGIFKSEQNDLQLLAMSGTRTDTDENGVYTASVTSPYVNFRFEQSYRTAYIHTLNGSPTGYELMCNALSIFQQLRALDDIAGRKVQMCVPAWEVYGK